VYKRRKGVLALTGTLAAALALPAAAGAAAPPCPPGTAFAPRVIATDFEDSRPTLVATHDIVVRAEWDFSPTAVPDEATTTWTGPVGVRRLDPRGPGARELGLTDPATAGFQPTRNSPLPLTVSWEQSDAQSGARCSASLSTTLNVVAARRPRAVFSNGIPRNRASFSWEVAVGRGVDRRPIEVRFRTVNAARLPAANVPFGSVRVTFRPTDSPRRSGGTIRRPFAQVRVERVADPDGLLVTFGIRRQTANPRLGYEIQLLQGGRRFARLRAAGSCSAFGCRFPRPIVTT
jgi:hypothetical protein